MFEFGVELKLTAFKSPRGHVLETSIKRDIDCESPVQNEEHFNRMGHIIWSLSMSSVRQFRRVALRSFWVV